MANNQAEFKLKYVIESDNEKAKSSISEVDQLLNKLGGGFIGSLENIAGPAEIAAGAIAGIGTAAIAAGTAIFSLAKSASEYGNEIYIAQAKTGLSAETLSTLKFNAQAVGSSLEQAGNGFAKFAKLIGQAADGSKEAQQTLKSLGITSTDLDTALKQAFKSVSELSDGTAQLAAAQKLFGRGGADLIPIIKQVGGNLDEAVQNAKKFGITLTDEDVKSAHEFDDALRLLGTQVESLTAQFALEFAPVITDAMTAVAKSFAKNKDDIRDWGRTLADLLTGITLVAPQMENAVVTSFNGMIAPIRALTLGLFDLGDAWNIATLGLSGYLAEQRKSYNDAFEKRKFTEPGMAGYISPALGYLSKSDTPKTGKGREASGPHGKSPEELDRERIRGIEQNSQREIQLRNATNDIILSRLQSDLQMGIISETAASDARQQIVRDFFIFRMDELDKELAAVQGNNQVEIEERAKLVSEKKVLEAQYEAELEKQRGETAKAAETDLNKQIDLWKKQGAAIADANTKAHTLLDTLANPLLSEGPQPGDKIGGATEIKDSYLDKILKGSGFDVERYKTTAQVIESITTDMSNLVVQSVNAMTQAVQQSLEAWILYGDSIGASLKKATASVLAQISAQSAVKAIFETAEGLASLAVGNFAGAALHFQAAAGYAILAVGTGLGARALSGGKNAGHSGSSSAGSGPSYRDNTAASSTPQPYSRVAPDTYISGSRNNNPDARFVAQAIDKLNQHLDRLSVARPGDVLIAGMKQKPGAVGNQAVHDVSKDSSIGTRFLKAAGQKR